MGYICKISQKMTASSQLILPPLMPPQLMPLWLPPLWLPTLAVWAAELLLVAAV
jgi:hypothetical protein